MTDPDNMSLVDSWILRLKNNRLVALIIVVGICLTAIASFGDNILKLRKALDEASKAPGTANASGQIPPVQIGTIHTGTVHNQTIGTVDNRTFNTIAPTAAPVISDHSRAQESVEQVTQPRHWGTQQGLSPGTAQRVDTVKQEATASARQSSPNSVPREVIVVPVASTKVQSTMHLIGPHMHHDFKVILSRREAETINIEKTKAEIALEMSTRISPLYAAIIVGWLASRAEYVQRNNGESGALVMFTVVSPAGNPNQIIGYRNLKIGGCDKPCAF